MLASSFRVLASRTIARRAFSSQVTEVINFIKNGESPSSVVEKIDSLPESALKPLIVSLVDAAPTVKGAALAYARIAIGKLEDHGQSVGLDILTNYGEIAIKAEEFSQLDSVVEEMGKSGDSNWAQAATALAQKAGDPSFSEYVAEIINPRPETATADAE